MHPDTFFRVLGPEPWRVAYCAPSRRPWMGATARTLPRLPTLSISGRSEAVTGRRAGPLPELSQRLRLDPREHDIRFDEDNWEAPTLGAAGVGWQVLMDGMEISQFTYFQQPAGSFGTVVISAEIT